MVNFRILTRFRITIKIVRELAFCYLVALMVFFSNAYAASLTPEPRGGERCGVSTSSSVVSVPFDFYVTENKGRWITMSATSLDIEFNRLNEGWPTRYKAFKFGGGAAITKWTIDTVPANGTLYEGETPLLNGAEVFDPDDLFFVPNIGFTGNDSFGYCADDSSGRSQVTQINLHVESASNYPMPVGIPSPGFGIDEEPPADPSSWPSVESEGNYYIDSDHPSCTDSNDFGTPDLPLCNIPHNAVVDAGGKMVLAESTEPYPLRSGVSWHRITLNGTASNPAWVVGDDRSPIKPRIVIGNGRDRGEFRIEGTGNYRATGIDMDGATWNNRGAGDNVVIRYSRMRNNPSTNGGGTTVGVSAEGDPNNILLFHVNANDNGIVSPTLADERDIHAFVGSDQRNFWMLDIVCSENAGDCVQLGNHNTTENVYVGRATMHSMMENCIDFKDFNKFIVSESSCWDIREVSYASGSGGLAQNFYVNDEGTQQGYGYFLNNRSWDTSGQNFAAANIGGRVYFIGNYSFFSPAAAGIVSSGGGGERHYYFNTSDDVLDGLRIFTSGSSAPRYMVGNYVGNVSRHGVEASAVFGNINNFDYNAFGGDYQYAWGSNTNPTVGSYSEYQSVTGFDTNSVENQLPEFVDAGSFDFQIASTSPLKDRIPENILDTVAPGIIDMQNDLGITLIDVNGTPRNDGFVDIGAFEHLPWEAPIGIPNPEFGINESVRMYALEAGESCSTHSEKCYDFGNGLEPYPISDSGSPYTHFVDNTHPNATNSNNPFGTATQPRFSIPTNVAAGSVVEINGGPYDQNTCQGGKTCMTGVGTSNKPIFFRGPSVNNKTQIEHREVLISDSAYLILENLDVYIPDRGNVWIRIDSLAPHHISVRNNHVYGDGGIRGNGGGIVPQGTDIVIYNNEVHDIGDWTTLTENDFNGVAVISNSERIWIVDNHIYHMGGDSVGSGHAANYTGSHYYIGRNDMHHNAENAVDLKEVSDVIISQNKMHGFRNTREGTASVVHYGPRLSPHDIWYIFNEIYDTDVRGIQIGGGAVNNPDEIYLVGNHFHDIDNPQGDATAIMSWSSDNIYIMGNTIHNTDVGMDLDHGNAATTLIENNLIFNLNTLNYIRLFQNRVNASMNNNLIYNLSGPPIVDGICINCIVNGICINCDEAGQ